MEQFSSRIDQGGSLTLYGLPVSSGSLRPLSSSNTSCICPKAIASLPLVLSSWACFRLAIPLSSPKLSLTAFRELCCLSWSYCPNSAIAFWSYYWLCRSVCCYRCKNVVRLLVFRFHRFCSLMIGVFLIIIFKDLFIFFISFLADVTNRKFSFLVNICCCYYSIYSIDFIDGH